VTEYEAWLSSLSPGDEVAVLGQLGAVAVARVDRAARRQVVVAGRGYRTSGSRAGFSVSDAHSQLAPATPERRADAERSALVSWLLDLAVEAGRGGASPTLKQLRAMRAAHAAPALVEVARLAADAVCICSDPDRCCGDCDGCRVRAAAADALARSRSRVS
jgi:hypothetical protein